MKSVTEPLVESHHKLDVTFPRFFGDCFTVFDRDGKRFLADNVFSGLCCSDLRLIGLDVKECGGQTDQCPSDTACDQ